MKKTVFILFSMLISSLCAFSQGSEIGPFGGVSFYMGDLNPDKLFYKANPAFGLVYRKILNPRYAIKSNLIYGTLEAYDADSQHNANKMRNLHFHTSMIDLSGQIEFNFLPYIPGQLEKSFSPYIFAGIAVFRFNPKAYIDNQWVDLKPLSTEGQGTSAHPDRKPYSLTQLSFPFGFGLKIAAIKRIALTLEWSFRKTSTDYLDDVSTTYPNLNVLAEERGSLAVSLSNRSTNESELESTQRGNSKNNDWYSFAGATLTYKIGPKIPKCPAYQK